MITGYDDWLAAPYEEPDPAEDKCRCGHIRADHNHGTEWTRYILCSKCNCSHFERRRS